MLKQLRSLVLGGLVLLLSLILSMGCTTQDPQAKLTYGPGDEIPSVEVEEVDVPDPFHTYVSTEFVASIAADNLLREEPRDDVMLIDSRPKRPRYDRGHIPTAVSLPDSDFEEKAEEVLPEDKSTLLVFYCMSPG